MLFRLYASYSIHIYIPQTSILSTDVHVGIHYTCYAPFVTATIIYKRVISLSYVSIITLSVIVCMYEMFSL